MISVSLTLCPGAFTKRLLRFLCRRLRFALMSAMVGRQANTAVVPTGRLPITNWIALPSHAAARIKTKAQWVSGPVRRVPAVLHVALRFAATRCFGGGGPLGGRVSCRRPAVLLRCLAAAAPSTRVRDKCEPKRTVGSKVRLATVAHMCITI